MLLGFRIEQFQLTFKNITVKHTGLCECDFGWFEPGSDFHGELDRYRYDLMQCQEASKEKTCFAICHVPSRPFICSLARTKRTLFGCYLSDLLSAFGIPKAKGLRRIKEIATELGVDLECAFPPEAQRNRPVVPVDMVVDVLLPLQQESLDFLQTLLTCCRDNLLLCGTMTPVRIEALSIKLADVTASDE